MRALGLNRVVWFYGLMAAVALVVLAATGRLMDALPNSSAALLEGLGFGASIALVVVFLCRLALLRFLWARALGDALRTSIGDLSAREILGLALLSGVAEELLFRGVVHVLVGLVFGSIIFGLLHTGPTRAFAAWPVMAFAVGLLLGLAYDWTGNLVAPIVAHVLINFLNLRQLVLRPTPALVFDGVGGLG